VSVFVAVYFVIDSVRNVLDTPSYSSEQAASYFYVMWLLSDYILNRMSTCTSLCFVLAATLIL